METVFRELSADELSFIAGGDPGDIVVTASPWGGYYGSGGGGGGGGGYGTSGGGGGGGGGDSPPPVNPPPPETPCERDAMEDTLAQALSDLIKSHPDWNSREYAASIIRYADGNYGVSALAQGDTYAEAQAREPGSPPQTTFAIGSLAGGAVVVGIIHNHPDIGYSDAEDLENRYPSYNPGYNGDYNTFDKLVGQDPRFASADQFTQYILGPDGVLREFGYLEGHLSYAADTNAASRSDLTADRPCS